MVTLTRNGKTITVPSERSANVLRKHGWTDPDSPSEYPTHVGGGTYELSNGERVKGKDDAVAAQAELDQQT